MIQIFHGDAFHKRYQYLRNIVASELKEHTFSKCLVILPSNRWERRFKQSLLDDSSSEAIFLPPVFSYSRFVDTTFEKLQAFHPALAQKKDVTPFFKELILQRIVTEIKPQLLFYTSFKNEIPRGVIRALISSMEELILAGYDPVRFKSKMETEGKISDKQADFFLIFSNYFDQMKHQFTDDYLKQIDIRDHFTKELFHKLFPQVTTLCFVGFDVYSHVMSSVIDQMSSYLQDTQIHINGDLDDEAIMAHTSDSLQFMQSLNPFIIKDELIREDRLPVKVNACANFDQEFNQVLQHIVGIKQTDASLRWADFTITLPELDKNANRIRRILNQFDIPYNLTTSFPLMHSQAMQFILLLFRLKLLDFKYKDVLRFFESSFVDHTTSFSPRLFIRFCEETRTYKNLSAWINALEKPENEHFNHLKHGLKWLSDIFNAHLEKYTYTIEGFQSALYKLLKEIHFLSHLTDNEYLPLKFKEPDVRAFSEFTKVFDRLSNALKLFGNHEKIHVSEIEQMLRQELSDASFQVREIPNYGLNIMPMLECRSEGPKFLYVMNLTQSAFPRKAHSQSLFNDEEREKLVLRDQNFSVEEDRYLLWMLRQKKSVFYFSYHLEAEGKPEAASILLEEILDESNSEHWHSEKHLESKKELHLTFSHLTEYLAEKPFSKTSGFDRGSEISQHTFSVTQLETYMKCPQQYYLNRILKLNVIDELDEEIKANIRGSFVHQVLFRYFTELNVEALSHEEKVRGITEIAREELKASSFANNTPFWAYESKQYIEAPSVFETFIEVDESSNNRYKPSHFEWRFGPKIASDNYEDKVSTDECFAIEEGGVRILLRGKIDRIDIDESGNIIVFDYKTGTNVSSSGEIKTFQSLQLPLYLLAIEHLFKTPLTPVAAGYFIVKNIANVEKKIKIGVKDKSLLEKVHATAALPLESDVEDETILSFEAVLRGAKLKVFEIIDNISSGVFPYTTDRVNCKYCDYKSSCRVNEFQRLHPEYFRKEDVQDE